MGMTMAELAIDMGLSKSTISRALHGGKGISASTVARVKSRAAECGYSVHPHLRTLMSQQRKKLKSKDVDLIAFVNDYESEEGFAVKPLANAIYRAAQDRALKIGCAIDWLPLLDSDLGGHKLKKTLKARGILGIILGPLKHMNTAVPDWMDEFALIASGSYWRCGRVDHVRADSSELFVRLVAQLSQLGAKRLGILFPKHLRALDSDLGAFINHLKNWDGTRLFVLEDAGNLKELQKAMMNSRIDGLLFHGNRYSNEIEILRREYPALKHVGEFYPGYGVPERAWCCAEAPVQEMGRTLVELVSEKINHGNFGFTSHPKAVVFSGTIRVSNRCASGSGASS